MEFNYNKPGAMPKILYVFMTGHYEVAQPVSATTELSVTEDGYVRLYILSRSPQDKLFCAVRADEANFKVSKMTDPWWVAGMHFDKMLKKHEQLVQDLKDHEALMAVRMQYCETEVLPQRALPIPAWASNTLQQALIGYQDSTTAKLGQMKEALVDPALKQAQVQFASITSDLSREL
ncbi:TPA: hypothetical protein ACH3X3_001356 [Trebouxia sp. C0006]